MIFLKTLRSGLPVLAVLCNSSFTLLSFMGIKAGSGRVFSWFVNITAVAGLIAWCGISTTYLRFYEGLKSQGIDRRSLPYSTRLQPFAAWYALIMCALISVVCHSLPMKRGSKSHFVPCVISSVGGKCSSKVDGPQIYL